MLTTIELQTRWERVARFLDQEGMDAAIFTSSSNMYYLTGKVVSGWFYITADAQTCCFLRRPVGLEGDRWVYVRKPEEIPALLSARKMAAPSVVGLEGEELSANGFHRLSALFPAAVQRDVTSVIRTARMVKTDGEVAQFRKSAAIHDRVYQQIPSLYRPGMTDHDLVTEIVHLMLQNGSLGLFRIFGQSMEAFVGSLLAGDNAGAPSPYDFALGGAGSDSIPIGHNGTLLQEGMTVMVDFAGNYTPYATDMTRVFSVGKLSDEARRAHQVSNQIHEMFMQTAHPGVICEELYQSSLEIAQKEGWGDCFMGGIQKASFVGHGIGLEINELPVLAPKFKMPLEKNMVIALEPKFVLPGIGAVGNENSYLITETGVELLTCCCQEILPLQNSL